MNRGRFIDADDAPIGRILRRREVLALFGGSGAALLIGCAPKAVTPQPTTSVAIPTSGSATGAVVAVPSCIVRPALTEGPYFVDEKLNRSDIRSDPGTGALRPGAPLMITLNVARMVSGSCTAFSGATVDLWQCDALGVYSDASDPSFNTRGQKFLRGYQVTDAIGRVTFTTIYPGWYQGRATHIHFKIRTTAGIATNDFTSQFVFDEVLNDQVYSQLAPYTQKGATGRMRNANDAIVREGGDKLILPTTRSGETLNATFDIGLAL